MVVITCVILHNFIHEHGSEDWDFARFNCDPYFIPTIYTRKVFPICSQDGSALETNAATMDIFRDDTTAFALAWT